MNLLTSVTCSNIDGNDVLFVAVDLTTEEAVAVLDLHRRLYAGGLLGELGGGPLVSEYVAPSFGLKAVPFTAFSHTDEAEAYLSSINFRDTGISELGEHDLSPFAGNEVRVECFRVLLERDTVRFSAMAKHGPDVFTTENIPLDVIAKMAAQPVST